MTIPLVILAFFSIVAGYLGLPEFAFPNVIAHWLESSIESPISFAHPPIAIEWLLIFISVLAAAIGLGLGFFVYEVGKGRFAENLRESAAARFSRSGAGFDALYRAVFIRSSETTAEGLSMIDNDLIDKGIGSTAGGVGLLANIVRWLQSGYARSYALAMFLGAALLALVVAFSGGLS